MAVRPLDDEVQRVIATAFDPDFYSTVYDDLPLGANPFRHYLDHGWREPRDPAPWFSSQLYLADDPELERRQVEPFSHFLTVGRYEGREVRPSRHAVAYFSVVDWRPEPFRFEAFGTLPPQGAVRTAAEGPRISKAQERVAVAARFDATFYDAVNPDVGASGMDLLAHFLMTGWLEGRDPTPWFSVRHYLETNPDVAESGVNPFAHYLIIGRDQGRKPRHEMGFRYDVIAGLKPAEQRIAEAQAAAAGIAVGAVAELAEGLGTLGYLHVTFSHDDYLAHAGGVQLCVRREAARFAERGARHLHLHPQGPWQMVRTAADPGPLGVMLDGERLGAFAPATVREALAGAAAGPGRRTFAIHSLLGHEPDETVEILAAAGMTQGFFWLHDFASLCAGFHLLRNDVADCAAPPPASAACAVCVYGPVRARHMNAHRRLFEQLSLTVVAPAQTTLDFWRSHGDLPARRAVVLPHAQLTPRGPARTSPRRLAHRRFRLGFLGVPTPLKGWPLFRELAERLAGDPRYELHHLGVRRDPAAPVAFHAVGANTGEARAMQEAVDGLELDAALIWPLCRETFSFTAYEAAAAGAAVITGPDSGNVAAFVTATGLGRVLADEAALMEAFASGEILALARSRRDVALYDLNYSGLSGELTDAA